jgi:hypothetical protein
LSFCVDGFICDVGGDYAEEEEESSRVEQTNRCERTIALIHRNFVDEFLVWRVKLRQEVVHRQHERLLLAKLHAVGEVLQHLLVVARFFFVPIGSFDRTTAQTNEPLKREPTRDVPLCPVDLATVFGENHNDE